MKLKDIDFRVWSKLENRYIEYPALAKLGSVLPAKVHRADRAIPFIEFDERDDEKEVEFWTGFRDLDNAKIYEGDIVRYREQNLLISYERATWYIINPSIDENIRVDCGTRLQGILECMKYHQNINTENQIDIEVIGNIHENKNLLDDSIEQSNTNKIKRMR